jgi:hypothetical protein
MRVLTSRPKRMIAATALFSAITLTGVGAAQATTSSPTHGGGGGSRADAAGAAGKAFGSCMREHGLKNFPDLTIRVNNSKGGGKDVRVTAHAGRGDRPFDPTSKAYKRALKACGPILTKAGVPLPPSPGDAHCKVIKGGKGEGGLPKPPNGAGKGRIERHIVGPGKVGPGKSGSGKGGSVHKTRCVIQKRAG